MKNKYSTLKWANIFFMLLFVYLMLFNVGVYLLRDIFTTSQLVLITPLVGTLPSILLFFLMTKESGKGFSDVFATTKLSVHKCVDSLAFGFSIYIPITIAVGFIQALLLPAQPEATTYSHVVSNINVFAMIFGFVILPPIAEELVFRGFFFSALKNKKPMFRIVFTSFLFALFHLDIYNFLFTFLVGLMLGALREKTGSIIAPILTHAGSNLVGLLFMTILSEIINNNVVLVVLIIISVGIFSHYENKYSLFKYNNKTESDSVLKFKVLEEQTEEEKKESFWSYVPLILPFTFMLVSFEPILIAIIELSL